MVLCWTIHVFLVKAPRGVESVRSAAKSLTVSLTWVRSITSVLPQRAAA